MSLGCINVWATDAYRFGFCDNTMNLNDKMIPLDGAMSVDAGVRFTAVDLERFAEDGSIEGINVGISSKFNIASIRVWLRDALTGEDIASSELTSSTDPALANGWNAAWFTDPVRIEAGHDYYAGYTMTLSNKASWALVSIQAGSHAESCWLKVGSGEWMDRASDLGILNLELLVSSSNLPQTDLSLTRAELLSNHLVPGQGVEVEYSLHNVGMKTVNSYTLTLADEEAGVSLSKHIECDLVHDARVTRTEIFDVEGLLPEHIYNFTLTVSNPNGEEDETPGDNVMTLPEITAINGTYVRTVLIEEFTTERCPNCPAAAKNLHQMYNTLTDSEKQRTAIVCHHSGFSTDSFTQPCDESYLFFYGPSGRCFAPAFMFNRSYKAERQLPVVGPQSYSGLKSYFAQEANREAFYSIGLTGRHDEASRTIHLYIVGKAAARIFENPRITVYLTEDDVPAVSQSNGGVDYRHDHLIRAYNSTWGVEPVWSDNFNYTSAATLTYPEGCKVDNMKLVAVLSNVNLSDCNDCEVGNAFSVNLRDLKETGSSGVDAVEADNETRVYQHGGRLVSSGACKSLEVYDLDGRRCVNENLSPGIYVVRVVAADGVTVRKVVVR